MAFSGTYGVGDNVTIAVKATARNSTVSHVNFYADNLLIGTATTSPFECVFVPTEKRTYSIMAIAVNAEGKEKKSKECELNVTSDTPTDIHTLESDAPNTPTYNLMGMPVSDGYRGIVIKNGKKFVIK